MRSTGLVPLVVAALAAACGTGSRLPEYGQVPEFQLVAQNGDTFGRGSLDGKVWVADFIFTTCPGPCPLMSTKMSRIQKAVAQYPDVRLVSFTVDPQHDTPPVLADYARRYQADPTRWLFLTGEPAALNELGLGAFHLQSVDGSMNHSTRFVLLDRRSRIRGYYETGGDGSLDKLLGDLARLRKEAS
jgi:protein SCO1/2